jgi:hypothetical protein
MNLDMDKIFKALTRVLWAGGALDILIAFSPQKIIDIIVNWGMMEIRGSRVSIGALVLLVFWIFQFVVLTTILIIYTIYGEKREGVKREFKKGERTARWVLVVCVIAFFLIWKLF